MFSLRLVLVLLVWVLAGALAAKAAAKLDGIVLVIADGTSLELITARAPTLSARKAGSLWRDFRIRLSFEPIRALTW